MITRPKNNFPIEYQQVAQHLVDKFEMQKWGAKDQGMADSKGKKRSNDSEQKSQSTKRLGWV
jgi:hypothetical protein